MPKIVTFQTRIVSVFTFTVFLSSPGTNHRAEPSGIFRNQIRRVFVRYRVESMSFGTDCKH
jgi:hypothetical protein